MIIYLLVFFISILFTYLAEISFASKNINIARNKIIGFLFSSFAILAPSLLAGFRDSGIGTDTLVYVDSDWRLVLTTNSFFDFLDKYQNGYLGPDEFIYLLLNWVASIFGEEVNYIYFLSNFIVVLLVYLTAYDNRNKVQMWFMMFLFLFLFYNFSLNIVRQSIALAMAMYSFKYFEQKKWIKLFIWIFIIAMTHDTGFVFFFLLIIYSFFNIKTRIIRRSLLCVILLSFSILFLYFDALVSFFVSWGFLSNKFLLYLENENDSITLSLFMIYLAILFIFIYCFKNVKDRAELRFFIYMKLIGIIFLFLSFVSYWAFRIGYYVNFMTDCLYLAQAIFLLKKASKIRHGVVVFICIFMFFSIWYISVVVLNHNETYPYTSKILGID